MSVKQLVKSFVEQGIHLEAEGDKLKIKAKKGALNSEVTESIKQNKQELIHFLNNQTPEQRRKSLPLVAVDRSEDFPLSFAQQSLWLSYQITGGGPAYNILGAMHLQGELNTDILNNCFVKLVQRHESLRTRIVLNDANPVLEIFREFDQNIVQKHTLPSVDNEQSQKAAITQWAQNELEQPFDLTKPPLYRVNLLKLGHNDYILCLTIHHIICDALSVGVLFRDLFKLYDAPSPAQQGALATLDIQYADFAYWHRLWLTEESLEAQKDFWLNKLAEGTALINLPTDYPRPAKLSHVGGVEFINFDAVLVERLRALSQDCGATLYMTVLTCLSTLLAKYSGQEQITLGSPFSHRANDETQDLVGFFINTIVMQNNIDQSKSIKTLIELVRDNALEAFAHADYPFERLVGDLNPQRSSSFATLFQIMFVFLPELPTFEGEVRGLNTRRYPMSASTAKFDLEFTFEQANGGLQLRLDYSKDLFKANTIQRLLQHLNNVLLFSVENFDKPIAQLDISNVEERSQVASWQAGPTVENTYSRVQDIFERQAALTPDLPAIRAEKVNFSYRDINQQANRLAHYLRQQGIGSGHIVALQMRRSIELFISVLATLKAGAAYLPLDLDYPQERIDYMLSNSGCSLLIADDTCFTKDLQCQVVMLDQISKLLAQHSTENLPAQTQADDPAYVMYTSGSTGTPKGVVMPHRALTNLIVWHKADDAFQKSATVLQYSPISFDVSFQESFSTWATGGCLVLMSDDVRKDPRQLIKFIIEENIERLFLPFVAFDQLSQLSAAAKALPTTLKEVYVAGEQLKITDTIRKLFERLGDCRLINHYGPTESHVVSALTLSGSVKDWPAVPSIGKPVANSELLILNSQQHSCALGAVGEIFIGGQIASGYINNLDMTSERFIHVGSNKKRYYRSGDLGRWLPSGEIEFLGRVDQQIKIRGYRIELGEVETCLQKYEGIGDTAVNVQQKDEGPVLIAYYTAKDENLAPGSSELRFYLEKKLPEYMVPSQFVILDALPLTPSGKLDRKALPSADISRNELDMDNDYVAPKSDTEIALVRLWQDMLDVDAIGIDDDFFDLGGNSIVATRLGAKIHQLYDIEMDLQRFFIEADVRHLATWLDVQLWAARSEQVPADSGTEAELEFGEI